MDEINEKAVEETVQETVQVTDTPKATAASNAGRKVISAARELSAELETEDQIIIAAQPYEYVSVDKDTDGEPIIDEHGNKMTTRHPHSETQSHRLIYVAGGKQVGIIVKDEVINNLPKSFGKKGVPCTIQKEVREWHGEFREFIRGADFPEPPKVANNIQLGLAGLTDTQIALVLARL